MYFTKVASFDLYWRCFFAFDTPSVWCGDIRKPGMWREINLSTFTMFHLVANRFFSRSTSFSLNINSHQCPLIVPLILFCYTRSRLSLGFPFEFRYISVLPPMILRSFFDRSSINLRFPNGEWTEDERRMNENRSRTDREPNENRTRTERRTNGERYGERYGRNTSIRVLF